MKRHKTYSTQKLLLLYKLLQDYYFTNYYRITTFSQEGVNLKEEFQMKLSTQSIKTVVLAAAITLLAIPALAGNGHGPGNGTGQGTGGGAQDGSGNGPGTGDCLNAAAFTLQADLLVRGGNGGGNGGGGRGDGSGSAPGDGTGSGARTGDCVNA